MEAKLPTSEEAYEGAGVALAAGEQLLHAARRIADMGQFGIATSLAILAAEERIKSFLLLIYALGDAVSDRLLRRILTQHRTRHDIAQIAFVLGSFLGEVMARLAEIEAGDASAQEKGRQRLTAIRDVGTEALDDDAELGTKLGSYAAWWPAANALKMRGFYTDFVDGKWSAPAEVTAAEFAEVMTNIVDETEVFRDEVAKWSVSGNWLVARREFLDKFGLLVEAGQKIKSR